MNRLTAYATTSVALTALILFHAFAHRPNTYSALVYLFQSNACILILANFFLLALGTIYFSLQRLCYGALRAVEVETLYERGWYQATELCLAATIFRDEVGWAFGGLFGGILAGKVWGWLGEGRVEWLQQRPPDNPRLFHTRLSAALLVSLLFDALMLKYCVDTVLEQARPGMFVMFSFEFAVLGVQSVSTLLRYSIVLREQWVVKEQQKQRLETRRAEVRAERAQAAEAARAEGREPEQTTEDDVELDPTDEDVPGWEAKGTWLFALDLATDFLKSILYLTFFSILLVFHGFPVHIIRDLIMTVRSLITRISGFIAYRHATRAMNTLPDASAEDLAQNRTCIVCREDMDVWNAAGPVQQDGQSANQRYSDERQRPKKLPCGHILHKGCLKAWLERQQTCPTCRRPVLPARGAQQNAQNGNGQAGAQPGHPAPQPARDAGQAGQRPQLQGWRINLGPLRLFVGRGPAEALRDQLRQQGLDNNNDERRAAQAPQNGATTAEAAASTQPTSTQARTGRHGVELRRSSALRQTILDHLQRDVSRELASLAIQQQQLSIVRGLQSEFARLSALQAQYQHQPTQQPVMPHMTPNSMPGFTPSTVVTAPLMLPPSDGAQTFVGDEAVATGSLRLPEGMILPEGWSVLPLTRLGGDGVMPLGAFTPHNTGFLGSDLAASVAPPASAGVIATALGLPPLPLGNMNLPTSNATSSSPTAGQPVQSSLSSTSNQSSFPSQPTLPHQETLSVPATTAAPQPPQSSVPIGDLLSRLAQAQEDAVRSSASPAPPIASPRPEHTISGASEQARGQTTPGWGFGRVAAQRPGSSGTDSSGTTESSDESEHAEQNGSAHEDKGKGRAKAATVEDDSDEDED